MLDHSADSLLDWTKTVLLVQVVQPTAPAMVIRLMVLWSWHVEQRHVEAWLELQSLDCLKAFRVHLLSKTRGKKAVHIIQNSVYILSSHWFMFLTSSLYKVL